MKSLTGSGMSLTFSGLDVSLTSISEDEDNCKDLTFGGFR